MDSDRTTPDVRPGAARRRSRWVFVLLGGGGLAVLLAAVMVAWLALPALAPARAPALAFGLRSLDAALPGSFAFESARWPRAGRIELRGVRWIDGADTLAVVDSAIVDLDVLRLWRRDLALREVTVLAPWLDVDALRARFPADSTARKKPGRSFLRDGPIPGLPSFAVRALRIDAPRIRVAKDQPFDRIALDGSIRLLRGDPPAIDVRHLTAAHPASELRIDDSRIAVDLSGAGRIEASGRGQFGTRWPFALAGTTDRDGRFEIGLVRGAGPIRPGADGLFARGRLEREGWRARGVDVDTFSIVLEDLKARGAWSMRDGRHDGRVGLAMRGTRWLSSIVTIEGLPDTLALTLDARLRGPTRALEAEVLARGSIHVSGVAFERTSVAAIGTLGEYPRLRFALRTEAKQVSAATTGELRGVGGRYEVRLAPVRLDDAQTATIAASDLPPAPPARDARLVEVPPASAIHGAPVLVLGADQGPTLVRDLRVTGGFGDGRVNARLDHGAGTFDGALAWPGPPEALIARAQLSQQRRDALRRAWGDSTRYRAEVRGRFADREPRLAADASFYLPGPAALAAFLPESVRVADLGPIEGTARFESAASGWRLTGDLDRTRWIQRLDFEAREVDGAIVVDRLDAELPGLTATVRSHSRGETLEGTLDGRVRDTAFLARFVPALREVKLRAAVQGRVRGRASAPDVDLAFIAAAASGDSRIPQLSGRALVRGGRLTEADAVAPHGADFGELSLDTLLLRYVDDAQAGDAATLPGRFSLAARGSDLTWTQSGHVRTTPRLTIATDSLRVGVYDKDLMARRPFDLTLIEGGFELDSLSLQGTMGTLAADGRVTRDVSDLTLTASLNPPELPAWMGVPSGLMPSKLDVHLRPARGDSLEMTIEAHGLQIASHGDLVARVRLLGHAGQIVASLRLDGEGDPIFDATARLPGRLAILAPESPALDGPVVIEARLKAFPLPPGFGDPLRAPGYLDRGGLERTLTLDGEVHLSGTGEQPEGTLAGTITFPGWKALKKDRIDVAARLTSRSGSTASAAGREARVASSSDGAEERGAAAVLAATPGGAPGITAKLTGTHDGHAVLDGDLSLPLRIAFAPVRAEPIAGRELALKVVATALPLQMLEPFAPALRSLEGRAEIHLTAAGSPTRPTFDAKARIDELEASTPERSRIAARGEITAAGSLSAPVVRGRVQIDHGVIMLPEQQKLLHPTEGQALLWQGHGVIQADPPDDIEHTTPPVKAEQLDTPPHGAATPSTAAGEARAMVRRIHNAADSLQAGNDVLRALDLQVQIVAPGGTWVRGRGLDVQLSGDVTLTQTDGMPTLVGDLETRGGGVELYGRRMVLEKGSMTFFGGRNLNPSIDALLSKRTSEVDITAHVTGTASNPRVEITSDPPLDEAEILSYLLFDRPLDNLDAAQNDRIEQRATGQAESYLAAQLTGRLSESLGLDLLSYERSQADSTGNGSPMVTLGKYLTPQILLKVEQDFSDERGFDVVLEYWIRRGLKVSTHAREDRSGVGLEWSRDY